MMKDFEKIVQRVAQMVAYGVDIDDVRSFLLGEGYTDEEAYLVFSAARVLAGSQ